MEINGRTSQTWSRSTTNWETDFFRQKIRMINVDVDGIFDNCTVYLKLIF